MWFSNDSQNFLGKFINILNDYKNIYINYNDNIDIKIIKIIRNLANIICASAVFQINLIIAKCI